MKILLAGTPFFSVSTFEQVINNFEVVGIISQPDRQAGRGMMILPTQTKMLAQKYKIKVFQPEKIMDIYDQLKNLDFDILLTMAYGQIIPEEILGLAKIGSFNVHASLLPKYRGAAPIQHAILNKEKETGITFMEMIPKMDAGDIIFQEKIAINSESNYDYVSHEMTKLSSSKIVEWLNKIKENKYTKTPQDESQATYAPKITSEEEKLDPVYNKKVEDVLAKINAFSSIPGAYIVHREGVCAQRIKIFKAQRDHVKNSVVIQCADDNLYATDYQIEGRKRVQVKEH